MRVGPVPGSDICVWALDDDTDSWDTTCGEKFVFIEGGPNDNKVKFCCYCGRTVKAVVPAPERLG